MDEYKHADVRTGTIPLVYPLTKPRRSEMKIVINVCWGGFGVNEAVYKELAIEWDGFGYIQNDDLAIDSNNYQAYRADPSLIAAIEKIGEDNAGGRNASLHVVEIPDDVEWDIDEYDGQETIHEVHRSWR
jgi:hypothetical protein